MKSRVSTALLALALIIAPMTMQGCYGRFGLTSKLYNWNGTVGDKWLNSIMMVAMCIVPVYGISLFADGVLFNTIEFWTGKNPVAMGPQEQETRIVSMGGKDFKVTATQNSLSLAPVEDKLEPVTLVFLPEEQAWILEYRGEKRKIAEQEKEVLTLLYPDGHREKVTH